MFVNLYNKGLIYQGNRIINWCPHCTTALSDAEVEYEEQAGHFWHIKYMFKDSDEYVIIATTRPETLLGDTAVAVHRTTSVISTLWENAYSAPCQQGNPAYCGRVCG